MGFTYMLGWGKVKTELLGKVKQTQMYKPNTEEWLLQRINPQCENCNSNEYYAINTSYRKLVVIFPLGRMEEVFRIICPNCGETIELEKEEFAVIEPFVNVNNLFELGKIDEYEYKLRLDKIEAKYLGYK